VAIVAQHTVKAAIATTNNILETHRFPENKSFAAAARIFMKKLSRIQKSP
jgi:hypothetical protein